MRNPWTILMLLIPGVLFFAGSPCRSQSPYERQLRPEAFLIRDAVEVFADRSLYVTGEFIQFMADVRTEGINEGATWSNVLYLELISSDGVHVSSGKYLVSDGYCTGKLMIPQGILTGNYFLKSYTRWMRNSGPRAFSYVPVKIVNPFKRETVDPGDRNEGKPEVDRREYTRGIIQVSTGSPAYGRGEEVGFEIYGIPDMKPGELRCCLTVVPEGGIDTSFGQALFSGSTIDPGDYKVNYLPDLKGISISGTVIRSGSGDQPVPEARIYISLLGEDPDYLALVSDESGRFVVSTPDRSGVQELFVGVEQDPTNEVEVRIDQDFDATGIPFSPGDFMLSTREYEIATRMALQKQFQTIYEQVRTETNSNARPSEEGKLPFYGMPGFSIMLDNFVTLPTLEEVFVNLVPVVNIVVKQGKRSMVVLGPNSAMKLYPPLILIDHIPVLDHQAVLSLNPEKIKKVDVINELYVKGDVYHGGIIGIYSRNGDMAGIDLSPNSYFFDFQSAEPASHDAIYRSLAGDRIPDMRNTLYWKDNVVLKSGASQAFSFKAPSTPGEYVMTYSPGVEGALNEKAWLAPLFNTTLSFQ